MKYVSHTESKSILTKWHVKFVFKMLNWKECKVCFYKVILNMINYTYNTIFKTLFIYPHFQKQKHAMVNVSKIQKIKPQKNVWNIYNTKIMNDFL